MFRGREPHTSLKSMKLINVLTAAAVVSASVISAQASDAYPSVTTICTELRVELETGMKEAKFNQQEFEQTLINCRDLQ